jgi:LEA14-like dessication related protein
MSLTGSVTGMLLLGFHKGARSMTSAMQLDPRPIALVALAVLALTLPGCAALQGPDPLHVTVVGVEPLEGQGLELRMLVKLRVQNPNDAPIDYNGVALEMKIRAKTFASGVSDAAGSVPRFGETVISVPVTVSAFGMLGQAVDMFRHGASGPITYEMTGKLNRSSFNSTHFQTQGEFTLPGTGAGDRAE